jgi:hypothetical protein
MDQDASLLRVRVVELENQLATVRAEVRTYSYGEVCCAGADPCAPAG